MFIGVKIIKARLKLYNDKDHHTNCNTNGQSSDVYNGITAVTAQTSECDLKVVPEHSRLLWQKLANKMPYWQLSDFQGIIIMAALEMSAFDTAFVRFYYRDGLMV
jgi:hypothetical protein